MGHRHSIYSGSVTACCILLMMLIGMGAFSGEALIVNPGFEDDANGDDVPDGWFTDTLPIYDSDPANARTGTRSIKTNIRNFHYQDFAITGGSHYTIGYHAKADTPLDSGALDIQWRRDSTVVGFTRGRDFGVGTLYRRYLSPMLAPRDANRGLFFARSAWEQSWIWLDDVALYDEVIHNGDFESSVPPLITGWHAEGSPLLDCTGSQSRSPSCAVRVDNVNYLTQDIAVSEHVTYLLTIWIRSSAPVTTACSIDWFDEDEVYLGSTLLDIAAGPIWTEHGWDIVPPLGGILGRVRLQPDTAAQLWIDDVALVWHTVTPQIFSPNNDGVYDTTQLAYSLVGPTSVTLAITTPSSGIVRILEEEAQKDRSVSLVEWDGTDSGGLLLPEGTYTYRLTIENAFTPHISMWGDIEIDTGRSYGPPSNQFADFFPRGIWTYGGGSFTGWDYDALFQEFQARSVNAGIVTWLPESRYPDALTAAETHGIRCILQNVPLRPLITDYSGYRALPESLMRSEAERLRDTYASYSALMGYYVIDEPELDLAPNVFLANTVLNDVDPSHPGFSAIANTQDTEEIFDITRPAVFLHYYYPLPIRRRALPSDFDGFIGNLELVSQKARDKDLQFWMILMGFSTVRLTGAPTPEEMRCQAWLSIAHGAQGIFYFIYQSSGSLRGLVDYDLNPTDRYDEVARLYAELESLESLLIDWRPAASIASISPASCIVKTFTDSLNNEYVIVVNKDCINPATPTVTVNRTGIQEIRDLRDDIPISFNERSSTTEFEPDLLPGDGRIFRIE